MTSEQFPLWRPFWIIALCASCVWLLSIRRLPTNPNFSEDLAGHHTALVGAVDFVGRSALCGLILVTPCALRRKDTDQEMWRFYVLAFAVDLLLLALSALAHIGAATSPAQKIP